MEKEKQGRGIAFENILRRRTEQALDQTQAAFEEKHSLDSDEALISYVRSCADSLGHAPNVCEIIGGEMILRRFGSWEEVMHRCTLGRPGPMPELRHCRIYREEKKRQLALWQREKKLKEARKHSRQKEALNPKKKN